MQSIDKKEQPAGAALDQETASRERVVLIVVILGIFLAAVDGTVVTTAMPTVIRSLGGLALYAWVFAVYMLTTAVTMPLWGKLADVRGARGLFVLGAAIFVCGSALSGLAHSIIELILFRGLQGLGAGALSAVPLTIIGLTFPPQRRGRALGMAGATWGVATVIGPLLASAILSLLSWRWVFYVNVPIGAVAIWLALHYVPKEATGRRHHIDWTGAALVALGIGALLVGMQLLEGRGPSLTAAYPVLAAGLALLAFFVWFEARTTEPVLGLFLFRSRRFVAANAVAFLSSVTAFGILVFLPLLAPPTVPAAVASAILIFPMSVSWATGSFSTGRLLHRVGVRPAVITGMALMATGVALVVAFSHGTSFIWTTALLAIPIGLGMGVSTPSLLTAVQNALPREDMGMGTAAQQFLRQLGGALGVSAVQLVFLVNLGQAARNARHAAVLHQAFLLPLAVAVLGFSLTWLIPPDAR